MKLSRYRQRAMSIVMALMAVPALSDDPLPRFLSDSPQGVACGDYSLAGRLRWQKKGGDWLDADGNLHGERPFATATPPQNAIKNGFRIDVTPLARQWLNGERINTGVFLRAGGAGILRLDSRETTEGSSPRLELEWQDGTVTRHSPRMDTTLDCSTYRSVGGSKSLFIDTKRNAIILFDLAGVPDGNLKQATAVLAPNRIYGRAFPVEVYVPHPPWAEEAAPQTQGIASRYPGDSGIANDPDVLFFQGFDAQDWRDVWRSLGGGHVDIVELGEGNGFESLQGSALRATLKEGENTALNLQYLFAGLHEEEPESIYFRYYLRFGDDWSPDVQGGKLPGIAGTYNRGGWGSRKADGTNGWSMRGSFALQVPATEGVPAYTPVGSYAYHADASGNFGSTWGWNQGPGGLLVNSHWYSIEQYVRLNTPGKNDGLFRAWIDGQLVYERANLNFRTTDALRIESIWMNIFHGGTRKAPRDMNVYIDNLVIARDYIGPIEN